MKESVEEKRGETSLRGAAARSGGAEARLRRERRRSAAGGTQRSWRLFDAEGRVLGRLATEVATALRGKDRPSFRPHEDAGAVVVVINTDAVRVTGAKRERTRVRWHTGWPGGLKERTFAQMMEKDSREVVRRAVEGMLPRNKLRRRMVARLKLYRDAEHPHPQVRSREPGAGREA